MNYSKIALLMIFFVIFIVGCAKKPICGNGIVEEGETMSTCCEDTGCLGEQECKNHKCIEPFCGECQYLENHVCKDYECCKNGDCSELEICENHMCKEIVCKTCEFIKNRKCVEAPCCSDSDCDDNNKNTVDKCKNPGIEEAKCVFREKEDFAIIESQASIREQDKVIEKFYENYDDDYDFLVLYTDFDYSGNIHAGGTAFHKIEGIGQPSYFGRTLGSKGKLRSTAFMGDVRKKFSGILEEIHPTTANGILHEIGHYWCCYVHFKDWNSVESDKLLQGGIHWEDDLLDVGINDPMGGRYHWREISPGEFKGTPREYIGKKGHYSDLTLYLMGLLPKDDVKPVKLIEPLSESTQNGWDLFVQGNVHLVEVDDIIAIEGQRIPNYLDSQKTFKVGFILWTRDKSQVSEETKDKVNRMRELFEEQWGEATKGLSTISTDLI